MTHEDLNEVQLRALARGMFRGAVSQDEVADFGADHIPFPRFEAIIKKR